MPCLSRGEREAKRITAVRVVAVVGLFYESHQAIVSVLAAARRLKAWIEGQRFGPIVHESNLSAPSAQRMPFTTEGTEEHRDLNRCVAELSALLAG